MPALILMYHDLADSLFGVAPAHQPYVLAPAVFRWQMKFAAESALACVTATDWVASGLESSRALVITFDDGHVSNHNLAFPILLELGLKATFFITAGRIGAGQTMNWQQIRAIHAAGMEIGSHTLTHRPPSTLNDKELRYELIESRRVLEDGLGAPVTAISSPTGFFNSRMCLIARESGYQALCFGRAALAADHGDPFSLPRIAIKRSTAEDLFKRFLGFDRAAIQSLRLRQSMLEFARQTLGVERYLQIRRMLMKKSHAGQA